MQPLCNPVASKRSATWPDDQLRLVELCFVCETFEPNASAQTSWPVSKVTSCSSSSHCSKSLSVSSYDNLKESSYTPPNYKVNYNVQGHLQNSTMAACRYTKMAITVQQVVQLMPFYKKHRYATKISNCSNKTGNSYFKKNYCFNHTCNDEMTSDVENSKS